MIPLGCLASAVVASSGVADGITYIGTAVDWSAGASFTFSGVDLGGTSANALTVIVVMWRGTSDVSVSVSGVTVDGDAATERADHWRGGYCGVAIYDIPTPAVSGDVVVTLTRSVEAGCAIFVYQVGGVSTLPAFSSAGGGSRNATEFTTSLTLPTGGALVIAGAACERSDATWSETWAPVTEDGETSEAYTHRTTASGDLATSGATDITCTWQGASEGAIAAAAYTRG